MRAKLIPWIIALILFAIPFFWLKSGEMDLGGDSSRLYFYDPLSYLQNYSLWSVSPSGFGSENIGFMTIPLVLILAVAKRLLASSTILISAFHGLSLATAFLFVYLIVKELIGRYSGQARMTSIIAGLLYVFSPISILGWDKVLMTHNHVFLNPLMFYLLLRYFITDKLVYLFWGLMVTFVFSANFSFVAAPVFFAFYPLSLLFLLIYKRYVVCTGINWKQLFAAGVLFILLQAFHIVPQVASMLSPGSVVYETVFSPEGKFVRGLNYFSAIAPSIKTSINLFILPQMADLSKLLLFMIFVPSVVIVGFMAKKTGGETIKKTLILTGGCFLAVLFFATANITDLGLLIYKTLFIFPGFSIFRNYYGQWAATYLFYYVLLFGIALSIGLRVYQKARILLGVFIFLLIVNAWPFINGALVNPVLWQSDNVRIAMKMDPAFAQAIGYLRQLPVDGKVLTLPLTDPGYQIVAGENGGAYQGPSIVAYLTGKQDFSGFSEMGEYGQLFLQYAKREDMEGIKGVLKLLGIKYLFHNSDPKIYDDYFFKFPYDYVRQFLPTDQATYAQFLAKLDFPLKAQFGQYYRVYEVPDDLILPIVYSPERIFAFNAQDVTASQISLLPKTDRFAFVNGLVEPELNYQFPEAEYATLSNRSPFLDFFKKRKDSPFPIPHVSRKPSWFLYPLVVQSEKNELSKYRKNDDLYLDKLIFYGNKRLRELEVWKDEIPIGAMDNNILALDVAWQEPKVTQLSRYGEYNQWTVILVKYYRLMTLAVNHILNTTQSKYPKIINQVYLEGTLLAHREKLLTIIDDIKNIKDQERKVLRSFVEDLIEQLHNQLGLTIPEQKEIAYGLPLKTDGRYEILVKTENLDPQDISGLAINVDNQIRNGKIAVNGWASFGEINLDRQSGRNLSLVFLRLQNVTKESKWSEAETVEIGGKDTALSLTDVIVREKKGALMPIKNYKSSSIYLIRFNYSAPSAGFSLIFYEAGGMRGKYVSPLKRVNLPRGTELSEAFLVRSGDEARSAFIQLLQGPEIQLKSFDGQEKDSVQIKALEVLELPHPEIVLRKVSGQRPDLFTPKIEFKEINPTKYRVLVREANKPFVLVLMQSFNHRWKITIPSAENETKSAKGQISRIIAKIMTTITSLLKLSQIHTFETWGQNSPAVERHVRVNGYANGWYINPENVGGKTEYELTLEMTTQKYFSAGALVSTLTLIVIMLILGWIRFAKR